MDLTDFNRAEAGFSVSDRVPKILQINKPKGGKSSPYRLGDFRGYTHKATGLSIQVPTLKLGVIKYPNGYPTPPSLVGVFNLVVKLPSQIPIGALPVSSDYIPSLLVLWNDGWKGWKVAGQVYLSSNNVVAGQDYITIPCHVPTTWWGSTIEFNVAMGLGNPNYNGGITVDGIQDTIVEYYIESENYNKFKLQVVEETPTPPVEYGAYFTKVDFTINPNIELIVDVQSNGSTFIRSRVTHGGDSWGSISGVVDVIGFDPTNGDKEYKIGSYRTPTYSILMPRTLKYRFELRTGV